MWLDITYVISIIEFHFVFYDYSLNLFSSLKNLEYALEDGSSVINFYIMLFFKKNIYLFIMYT